jgi:hypothetical protein
VRWWRDADSWEDKLLSVVAPFTKGRSSSLEDAELEALRVAFAIAPGVTRVANGCVTHVTYVLRSRAKTLARATEVAARVERNLTLLRAFRRRLAWDGVFDARQDGVYGHMTTFWQARHELGDLCRSALPELVQAGDQAVIGFALRMLRGDELGGVPS